MTIEYLDETTFLTDEPVNTPHRPAKLVTQPHAEEFMPAKDDRGRFTRACTCGARYLSRDSHAVERALTRHFAEVRKMQVMAVQCP